MENYTYMTLLTNNTYIQGVILLNETLKQVKSKYPLIVLVTNEVTKNTLNILDYLKIKWKLVDIVKVPEHLYDIQKKQNQRYIPPYNVLTKLQIYNQYEYDKICYLDSDIMVLKNIDFLFENEDFTCTRNFQYQRDNSDRIYLDSNNKKVIQFNTKQWYFPDRINTGFLLFSPQKNNINLINFMNNIKEDNFKGIDQRVECDETVLELFLSQNNIQLNILDKYFNTAYWPPELLKVIDQDLRKNSYFIHFAGPFKPWNIGNQLFKLERLLIEEQKKPKIQDYSLINDAINIISNCLFSLPLNLFLNFTKQCAQENNNEKLHLYDFIN